MSDKKNICCCDSKCKPTCGNGEKTNCNGMCFLDKKNNICVSCNRTITEIINWGKMTNEERLNILNG